MPRRRRYYVYFHRDRAGNIFYVGKGTGRRAWSRDRHPVWQRYVDEHLGGEYSVEIVRMHLSEAEAEDLEAELIDEYGEQLVNWDNWGRQFDYAALERFHARRNANRKFVAETRTLEDSDPAQAVARYREALNRMREYESMVLERGLVAKLAARPKSGEPVILDRITLCLGRLGRASEAIAEAEEYFRAYPGARDLAVGKTILKRIERLRFKSKGTRTAAR